MPLTPPQKAALEADFQVALSQERTAQNAHHPPNPRFLQRRKIDAVRFGDVDTWTDEYDGPSGKGWLFYGQATVGGTIYQRREDSGAEPGRSQGWEELN